MFFVVNRPVQQICLYKAQDPLIAPHSPPPLFFGFYCEFEVVVGEGRNNIEIFLSLSLPTKRRSFFCCKKGDFLSSRRVKSRGKGEIFFMMTQIDSGK